MPAHKPALSSRSATCPAASERSAPLSANTVRRAAARHRRGEERRRRSVRLFGAFVIRRVERFASTDHRFPERLPSLVSASVRPLGAVEGVCQPAVEDAAGRVIPRLSRTPGVRAFCRRARWCPGAHHGKSALLTVPDPVEGSRDVVRRGRSGALGMGRTRVRTTRARARWTPRPCGGLASGLAVALDVLAAETLSPFGPPPVG